MKKISDPKALTFGVWDLKTSLRQNLWQQGLIKALVQNPGSNFHKQDLIFSKIMREIQYNHEISNNVLT